VTERKNAPSVTTSVLLKLTKSIRSKLYFLGSSTKSGVVLGGSDCQRARVLQSKGTCYANATLNCILHSASFTRAVDMQTIEILKDMCNGGRPAVTQNEERFWSVCDYIELWMTMALEDPVSSSLYTQKMLNDLPEDRVNWRFFQGFLDLFGLSRVTANYVIRSVDMHGLKEEVDESDDLKICLFHKYETPKQAVEYVRARIWDCDLTFESGIIQFETHAGAHSLAIYSCVSPERIPDIYVVDSNIPIHATSSHDITLSDYFVWLERVNFYGPCRTVFVSVVIYGTGGTEMKYFESEERKKNLEKIRGARGWVTFG
jgi:hypothetical protein